METSTLPILLMMQVMGSFLITAILRSTLGARDGERLGALVIALASLVLALFSEQLAVPFWVSPATGAATIALLFIVAAFLRDDLLISVSESKDVAEHTLHYFETLDIDKDGIVSDDDLLKILNEAIPVPDLAMVQTLRRDLRHAGHVLRREYVVVPCSVGASAVPVSVYGVSREDLRTYPQRIRDLFEAEYDETIA